MNRESQKEDIIKAIKVLKDTMVENDVDPIDAAAAMIDYLGYFLAIFDKDEEECRDMFATILGQRDVWKAHIKEIISSSEA